MEEKSTKAIKEFQEQVKEMREELNTYNKMVVYDVNNINERLKKLEKKVDNLMGYR